MARENKGSSTPLRELLQLCRHRNVGQSLIGYNKLPTTYFLFWEPIDSNELANKPFRIADDSRTVSIYKSQNWTITKSVGTTQSFVPPEFDRHTIGFYS